MTGNQSTERQSSDAVVEIDALSRALQILEGKGDLCRQAGQSIMALARTWLATHEPDEEAPLWLILDAIPPELAREILRGEHPELSAWTARLLDWAPSADRLPRWFFEQGDDEIDTWIKAGLPVANLLSEKTGLELWLTRNADYGEKAFRRAQPRKDPVVAYLEASGMRLPKQGLHPKALEMMAAYIESRAGKGYSMAASRRMGQAKRTPDWQIVLALLSVDAGLPRHASDLLFREQFFGKDATAHVRRFFGPGATAHEKLLRLAALKRLPSVRDILSLPRRTPDDEIIAILTRAERTTFT